MAVLVRRGRGARVADVVSEAAAGCLRERMRERRWSGGRGSISTVFTGTFLCQWRSDDYVAPGERNKVNPDKQLTNRVVAAAAVGAAAHRRLPPSDAAALVLDASDAKTSEKLSMAFSYFGVGGFGPGERFEGARGSVHVVAHVADGTRRRTRRG